MVAPTQFEANTLVREIGYVLPELHRLLYPGGINFLSIKAFASKVNEFEKVVFVNALTTRWRYLNAIPIKQTNCLNKY